MAGCARAGALLALVVAVATEEVDVAAVLRPIGQLKGPLSRVLRQAVRQHRSLAAVVPSGQDGRRLQAATLCTWTPTGGCSPSNDYAVEQLVSLPADSPFRTAWTKQASCQQIQNQSICTRNTNCDWEAGSCGVSLSDNDEATLLGQYTATSTCGVLGAMYQQAQCTGYSTTKCSSEATQGCSLVDGQIVSSDGKRCVDGQLCMPADEHDPDALITAICPAKATTAACMTDMKCLLSACPTFAAIYDAYQEAQAEADDLCSYLPSYDACSLGSNDTSLDPGDTNTTGMCEWNPDAESCDAAPVQIWQILPTVLDLIPESCALKGLMMKSAACSELGQADCIGECAWQIDVGCDGFGNLQNSSSCGLSLWAVLGSVAQGAANQSQPGIRSLVQANSACSKKSNQTACASVPRPQATGTNVSVVNAAWGFVAAGAPYVLAVLVAAFSA